MPASSYLTSKRFASYATQMLEILNFAPQSVLEIGSHLGIVTKSMRCCGLDVTTLDINRDWHPDLVGSVLAIPAPDESFDVVVCCEVLEHIPFEDFPKALREIYRVARDGALITLPHYGRYYSATFKLPRLERVHFKIELPYIINNLHVYDGDHYWEIGKRGYSVRRIVRVFREIGWCVTREYRIQDNPYHHVFAVRKH